MRRVFRAAALLLVAPLGLAEAQSNPSTPEQVVREFFKAEQDGRWIDAAHLLDLTGFEPIRRSAIGAVRSVASRPKTTAQQLMQSDPGMPLAVAEYEVKRMNEGSRSFDFLSHEFARVPSADSLARLPLDEAAARWLEARGSEWQEEIALKESKLRGQIKCPEVPDSNLRAMRAQYRPPLSTIMGATEASDSVRYVVVRFSRYASVAVNAVEPPYPDMSPRALTLRKINGSWKIAPAPDMPQSDAFGGSMSVISCTMEEPSKSGAPKK